MPHSDWWVARWLMLAPLACCGDAHKFSVGEADRELHIDACYGKGVECATQRPAANILRFTEPNPTDCRASDKPQRSAVWARNVGMTPCPPIGQCSVSQMLVAGDGSVWAVGEQMINAAHDARRGGVVSHYSAEGAVLAEKVVEYRDESIPGTTELLALAFGHGREPSMTVAVNAENHAVLAVGAGDGTTPWLATYDGTGNMLGEKIPIFDFDASEALFVSSARDRGILLYARDRTHFNDEGRPAWPGAHSSLSMLDANLAPLWVQTEAIGPSLTEPSIDARGVSHILVTDASLDPSLATDPTWQEATMLWSQYDPHGNLLAAHGLVTPDNASALIDQQGNLIVVSQPGPAGELVVEKRDAAGQPLWSRRILESSAGPGPLLVTVDEDDAIYVVGGPEGGMFGGPLLFYALDRDGRDCSSTPIMVNAIPINAISVQKHYLYYGFAFSTSSSTIGRIAL